MAMHVMATGSWDRDELGPCRNGTKQRVRRALRSVTKMVGDPVSCKPLLHGGAGDLAVRSQSPLPGVILVQRDLEWGPDVLCI